MTITYTPQGVCSQQMTLEIDNGVITSLTVLGGCSGNLQGIARLVAGLEVDEAIRRLEGIRCGNKPTSCPDQLSHALRQYRAEK